jgi:glyoxylate reductase
MPAPSSPPVVAVSRTVPGTLTVPGAEVRVLGDGHPARDDLLAFVKDAGIVVSMFSDRVDAELLDAAGPGLRGVCNFAVGFNNIDLDACRERGVIVTNTPDAVTEGTADIAWLLVLAVARRLIEGDRFARTGAWQRHGPLGMAEFLGMDLTGRTLLVVGAGRIGSAVASRAKAWGMRVLYTARTRKWNMELAPIAGEWVDLDEGLAAADVVSVHTPLTDATHHLIDARRLGLMKRTAILVNTARGPVVDEAALAEALREKRIWGAGLDVFEREPEIHEGLLDLDNVTMTPHIGSAEVRFREAMTQMVADNAGAILAGETPPNRVA